MNLDKIKKIHFVGIGGAGTSAVARMMLALGKKVSGSDISESPITRGLCGIGVNISTGHNNKLISNDIDLVVYSLAVSLDNTEILRAIRLNIPLMSYPEILGEISKNYYTVAISGTHGKTTTTAMAGKLLRDANLSPTIIVGSIINKEVGNFVLGRSKYLITEACEYRRSFLNLYPQILVITNIEKDHLDYYKNLTDIQNSFREISKRVNKNGFIICNPSHPNLPPVIKGVSAKIIDYTEEKCPVLKVLGEHNKENAKAAISVAKVLGVNAKNSKKSIKNFNSVWRRFEYKGKTSSGALLYDDYAHHPTEIKATIATAREQYPNRRIIVVFQPHLYSRTKQFLHDFAQSFNNIDSVIIAPVYAAREKESQGINSLMLAEKIKKHNKSATALDSFPEIEQCLSGETKRNDIIITMGAGDIYKVGENLLNKI